LFMLAFTMGPGVLTFITCWQVLGGSTLQAQVLSSAQSIPAQSLAVLPPGSATALSWRNHPSYQVFAYRASLPAMTGRERTINVGAKPDFSFSLGQQLQKEETKLMSDQVGVPAAVLRSFLQQLGKGEHILAEQAAQQLRTMILD